MQASGKCTEIKSLLEVYDVLDANYIYSDRFLLEYANAAWKCHMPNLAINALSRVISIQDVELKYLAIRANIAAGRYSEARRICDEITKRSPLWSAFISLYTYLSFIGDCLGVKDQPLNPNSRQEFLELNSAEEALAYIIEVDATHPHAWLVFANKDVELFPQFNEPEFYYSFGAFLGYGKLLYRNAFLSLVQKIYSNDPNGEVLKVILTNLLEEALIVRGRNFIDYLFEEFTDVFDDEDVLAELMNTFSKIQAYHERNKGRFSARGGGFIGNDIYIPSILHALE